MKKRILVVLFKISKAREHEWLVELVNKELFELEFALISSKGSYMDHFLIDHHIKTWYFDYNGKKDLPGLTWNLFRLMKKNRYDVVHTHLFEANIAGLTAASFARVPKRILTRHHADFHHVYYPSAVKYDKLTNRLSTHIVAVSKNVENILIRVEKVPPHKVQLIHHGIDINDYLPGAVSPERISKIRKTYHLENTAAPVVGVISRFIELKGLQYLIPAFKDVLKTYPDCVLLLANAKGSYTPEVTKLLADINPVNYRLVTFENDVTALYKVFDCFVHIPVTPTAEAFGQIYLESLASKVPSIFTLSGVAPEFAVDKQNCFIVPFKDSDAVRNAILYILGHPFGMETMLNNGFEVVKSKFDIHVKISKLEKLYS